MIMGSPGERVGDGAAAGTAAHRRHGLGRDGRVAGARAGELHQAVHQPARPAGGRRRAQRQDQAHPVLGQGRAGWVRSEAQDRQHRARKRVLVRAQPASGPRCPDQQHGADPPRPWPGVQHRAGVRERVRRQVLVDGGDPDAEDGASARIELQARQLLGQPQAQHAREARVGVERPAHRPDQRPGVVAVAKRQRRVDARAHRSGRHRCERLRARRGRDARERQQHGQIRARQHQDLVVRGTRRDRDGQLAERGVHDAHPVRAAAGRNARACIGFRGGRVIVRSRGLHVPPTD